MKIARGGIQQIYVHISSSAPALALYSILTLFQGFKYKRLPAAGDMLALSGATIMTQVNVSHANLLSAQVSSRQTNLH